MSVEVISLESSYTSEETIEALIHNEESIDYDDQINEAPLDDNDSKASTDIGKYLESEDGCLADNELEDVEIIGNENKTQPNKILTNSQDVAINILSLEKDKENKKEIKRLKRKNYSHNLSNITTVINKQMAESTRRPTKASLARKRKIRERFLDVENQMKDGP